MSCRRYCTHGSMPFTVTDNGALNGTGLWMEITTNHELMRIVCCCPHPCSSFPRFPLSWPHHHTFTIDRPRTDHLPCFIPPILVIFSAYRPLLKQQDWKVWNCTPLSPVPYYGKVVKDPSSSWVSLLHEEFVRSGVLCCRGLHQACTCHVEEMTFTPNYSFCKQLVQDVTCDTYVSSHEPR